MRLVPVVLENMASLHLLLVLVLSVTRGPALPDVIKLGETRGRTSWLWLSDQGSELSTTECETY